MAALALLILWEASSTTARVSSPPRFFDPLVGEAWRGERGRAASMQEERECVRHSDATHVSKRRVVGRDSRSVVWWVLLLLHSWHLVVGWLGLLLLVALLSSPRFLRRAADSLHWHARGKEEAS